MRPAPAQQARNPVAAPEQRFSASYTSTGEIITGFASSTVSGTGTSATTNGTGSLIIGDDVEFTYSHINVRNASATGTGTTSTGTASTIGQNTLYVGYATTSGANTSASAEGTMSIGNNALVDIYSITQSNSTATSTGAATASSSARNYLRNGYLAASGTDSGGDSSGSFSLGDGATLLLTAENTGTVNATNTATATAAANSYAENHLHTGYITASGTNSQASGSGFLALGNNATLELDTINSSTVNASAATASNIGANSYAYANNYVYAGYASASGLNSSATSDMTVALGDGASLIMSNTNNATNSATNTGSGYAIAYNYNQNYLYTGYSSASSGGQAVNNTVFNLGKNARITFLSAHNGTTTATGAQFGSGTNISIGSGYFGYASSSANAGRTSEAKTTTHLFMDEGSSIDLGQNGNANLGTGSANASGTGGSTAKSETILTFDMAKDTSFSAGSIYAGEVYSNVFDNGTSGGNSGNANAKAFITLAEGAQLVAHNEASFGTADSYATSSGSGGSGNTVESTAELSLTLGKNSTLSTGSSLNIGVAYSSSDCAGCNVSSSASSNVYVGEGAAVIANNVYSHVIGSASADGSYPGGVATALAEVSLALAKDASFSVTGVNPTTGIYFGTSTVYGEDNQAAATVFLDMGEDARFTVTNADSYFGHAYTHSDGSELTSAATVNMGKGAEYSTGQKSYVAVSQLGLPVDAAISTTATINMGENARFSSGELLVGYGMGGTENATGVINATSTGSLIDVTGIGTLAHDTYIGNGGMGTVNLANGGRLSSVKGIVLGADTAVNAGVTTGMGIINIGGIANGSALGAGQVAGDILTTDGSGVINFNHTGSDYTFGAGSVSGDIAVHQYAGVTRLNNTYSYTGGTMVHGGTLLVGSDIGSSAFSVLGGGVLGGSGRVGQLSNAGTISPGAGLGAGQFTTLTVEGGYLASGDALLHLRTALGGDGSLTDKLVFDGGTVGGSTRVSVQNVGGSGGGTSQGIRVIQAVNGATIGANAFTLAGNACAGIFCYDLTQGDGTTAGQYDYFLKTAVSDQGFQEVFTPVAQVGQQAQVQITGGLSQNLFVARNAFSGYLASVRAPVRVAAAVPTVMSDAAPASSSGWYWPQQRRHAAYLTGSFGAGHGNDFGNHGYSGTAGIVRAATDSLAFGVGFVASRTDVDTALGGSNRMEATGGSFLTTYEPGDEGIRLYGSATLAYLDMDSNRHYTNGGGVESSQGGTDGYALGLAGRAGYAFRLGTRSSVMPYAEVQWTRLSLDGYTETGTGSLPATVADQLEHRTTTHLGAEYSRAVADDLELRLRGAWGHELNGGASAVNTSTLGFSQTVYGISGDRDWAEGGVTGIWHASDATTFTADLSGRAGKTQEPAANVIIGISVAF